MKSPHYAAGVTALYRKYTDYYVEWDKAGRCPGRSRRRICKGHLYIRSALSTGYIIIRETASDLLTIDKPLYAGTDDRLLEEIEEKHLKSLPGIGITGMAVQPGQPAMSVTAEETRGNGERESAHKSRVTPTGSAEAPHG